MIRRMRDGILSEDVMPEKEPVIDHEESDSSEDTISRSSRVNVDLGNKIVELKNYLGNKQLLLSGKLLALLFEDLFKSMNVRLKTHVDKVASRPEDQIPKFMSTDIITNGLENSLSTGNWNFSRMKIHMKGVTQNVSRLSFIGSYTSMTKISTHSENSRNVGGSRALHLSELGMYCPCDTPVGEACGLVKHLALNTHVTTDIEEDRIISLCRGVGVEELNQFIGEELQSPSSFLVLLNGRILGKHRRPKLFSNNIRQLRRGGEINAFISIHVNEKQRCVYIASNGGRVCRPLVIADINGESRIKKHHIIETKKMTENETKRQVSGTQVQPIFELPRYDGVYVDRCLREGLLEYLDADEQNDAEIALTESEATSETTHFEFESSIFGASVGLIPFAHHNSSVRNIYQCAIGKQAMGNIAYNQLCRMDIVNNLLVYPQRPLLTTKTIELIGYDKLGAGENAIVAVMPFSGYDLKEAIVMNKSSLDRGFGRCIVMKRMSMSHTWDQHTDIRGHDQIVSNNPEKILDNDGLVSPGEIIKGPCTAITSKHTYKVEEGESAVVDRVALRSEREKELTVKVMIRHTRRPEVGDRFSSRHGQKSVCGIIVQQEDLPFSERGIVPDLILNPHMFPSGRALGKMLEVVGSKAYASTLPNPVLFGESSEHVKKLEDMSGKMLDVVGSKDGASKHPKRDPNRFGESSGRAKNLEDMSEILVKHGFCYTGKDFMYSGTTGEALQAYVFMGPLYYQKLKHMVIDKMHARSTGPLAAKEGLRMGEMQRDCLIAWGASNVIYERFLSSSTDPCDALVCTECGLLVAYIDHQNNAKCCSHCKNGDHVLAIKLPHACKQLIHELMSMNIVPRFQLAES